MTPEERVELVTRAGDQSGRLALVLGDGSLVDPMIGTPYSVDYRQHLLSQFRAAVAEEREACAKVAEGVHRPSAWYPHDAIADEIAAAIRARGKE